MSNYIWREAASNSYQMDSYYAKNFSLAWINWELNRQEEKLLKRSKSEIGHLGNATRSRK
jgi:hypothetical protein